MANVIIKDSPLEGRGLFADRDFKKGERVTSCNTEGSFAREEAEKLPAEQRKRLLHIGNGKYGLVTEPACFVNHSCDPNTEGVNKGDMASRDIKAGEEITADYTADEDSTFVHFRCNCRSGNSKKYVG